MGAVKHILITGASGYLGRNLVLFLSRNNYEVSIFARANSDLTYLDQISGKFNVYRSETTTGDAIFKANSIDAIIHTAASYGRKGENLIAILDSNLMMPLELLDAAIKHKVKYFINTDTSLPNDLNDYSRSKKQFLEWLKCRSHMINIVNLELEYFFGPNDDYTKFITYVINELRSGKTSIDFTQASQLRDFIYIDDVVDAYGIVLENLEELKRFINIPVGSGNALMLRDIILEIQDITSTKGVKLNFGALPMRPNEIMESVADNSFLKELGWTPKYTLKEGLYKTIELDNKTL